MSSSMASSEFAPSTAPSGLPVPACRTVGFSVKTCLIKSGFEITTKSGNPISRAWNMSPYLARARRIIGTCRSMKPTDWIVIGMRGPGGNPLIGADDDCASACFVGASTAIVLLDFPADSKEDGGGFLFGGWRGTRRRWYTRVPLDLDGTPMYHEFQDAISNSFRWP